MVCCLIPRHSSHILREPTPLHELPITQGLLSVVVETATQAGAERVHSIDIVIGELTSIVDDSVQFYFDILSRGTVAEGAELRFRREPATATCLDCGHSFAVRPPLIVECPQCHSALIRVSGGNEFYVQSIEVDDDT